MTHQPFVESLVVGPLDVNCYIVGDETTRECVIIDPGGDEEIIAESVAKKNLKPTSILLTHSHFDHVGAAEAIKRRYNIPLGVGTEEAPCLEKSLLSGAAFYGFSFEPTRADFTIADGDKFQIGNVSLTALSTPGHSAAGVSFLGEGILFSGDVLFYGGIGRYDLPGASLDALNRSLARLLSLPDATRVYPGHGPMTTIGREKQSNPYLHLDSDSNESL